MCVLLCAIGKCYKPIYFVLTIRNIINWSMLNKFKINHFKSSQIYSRKSKNKINNSGYIYKNNKSKNAKNPATQLFLIIVLLSY